MNGSSTEKFKPEKGLRQGDSLSPYLFLMVVEILSKLMNDAVERGQLSGFKVADTGTVISHLQFADDTLIFLNANSDKVTRLFIILSILEALTGMRLNLEKSTMISVGADDVIEVLAKELGCKTKNLSIKYLGLPIGVSSRFKWVWKYSRQKKVLWRRIVQQKMKAAEDVMLPTIDDEVQGKSLWKNVSSMVPELQNFMSFKMRNGKGIRFWYDKWLVNGCIKDLFSVIFKACTKEQASVADMISPGRWSEIWVMSMLVDGDDEVEFCDYFSTKACYDALAGPMEVCSYRKFLWKNDLTSKVGFMLWAAFNNSLPTRDMLRHRGVEIDSSLCVMCNTVDESADHLFLHCQTTFKVWDNFIKAFHISWTFPGSIL
ncbi:uncharacterized protein LOC113312180 [Papaver somniferum]|uniref:uncharacterized protein LOC113312180 n=1 Tax=Papaver somniferum TaxID=3469 RepID=UPI000E701E5C|nr:uncharacterized protein LOC113312180 [Papaver somniferum]